jgi:hypothetical protein
MYFCIDGSNHEVVIGSKRIPINVRGFELSVTVEYGTLAIHWYKKQDRCWSLDFPWRPQLVDMEYRVKDVIKVLNKYGNAIEVTEYEIRELFVPWCLRRARFCHRLFRWRNDCAIGIEREGKTTYRRVKSVDAWLRKNFMERIHDRLRVPSDSAPTS